MDGTRKNRLSKVTQTQKDKYNVLTHKWLLDIKQRITNLQSITPENLDNKEDPKRDGHGYA